MIADAKKVLADAQIETGKENTCTFASGVVVVPKGTAVSIDAVSYTHLDGNMTVFQEVDGTNWLLISYIPTSIVLSDLTQLRNIMIVISVICIAWLCVLIERVTHVVIKPVKEMTRVITACLLYTSRCV